MQSTNARAHELIDQAIKALEELNDIAENNMEDLFRNDATPKPHAVKNGTALEMLASEALRHMRDAKFCCHYLKM